MPWYDENGLLASIVKAVPFPFFAASARREQQSCNKRPRLELENLNSASPSAATPPTSEVLELRETKRRLMAFLAAFTVAMQGAGTIMKIR